MNTIKSFLTNLKQKFTSLKNRATVYIEKNPFRSFYIVLGSLLVLIVLSNLIRSGKVETKTSPPPLRSVRLYNVGKAPTVLVQAQVEKSGVIQIVAQSPGIVQYLSRNEGEIIGKGETVANLSTNYQGGNSFSIQRQIAQKQYQNITDTYDQQKNIIGKQRDTANKSHENADQLRDISSKSIDETKSSISLNQDIINSIDQNIRDLEANAASNSAMILASKQLKSQFQGAATQLQSAIRNLEYQTNTDKPPHQLALLQRDITLRQLELQEKTLDLTRDVSKLQLQLAQVTEAMMYPASPVTGTVERVYVRLYQAVNPGTPIMTISQTEGKTSATAIAYVSSDMARQISRIEPAVLRIGNMNISAVLSYISTQAVQGTLHAVYIPIPQEHAASATNNGYIQIELPIGYYDTGSAIPYIPLDAIYQTSSDAYVFVNQKGKTVSKNISISQIVGRYAQVESGIKQGDAIIIDRTVVSGDRVNIIK